MKKYKIYYTYNGEGSVIIEANSEEEAADKFDNEGWEGGENSGWGYEISDIEKP